MSMLAFQLLIVLRSAGSMVKKASRFSSILGSLVDYASTGQVTMCRDVRHARTQDRRATVSEDSRGGWKRWCRNKKKETGGEARGNSSCLTLGMQTKPSWRDHAIRSTFSADGTRRAHALLPFTTRLASLDRRVEGFVRSRGHRVSGRTVDEPVD